MYISSEAPLVLLLTVYLHHNANIQLRLRDHGGLVENQRRAHKPEQSFSTLLPIRSK